MVNAPPGACLWAGSLYHSPHPHGQFILAPELANVAEPILDKPTEGRLAAIAPTLGSLFVLIANHPMMHVGQFVVMRRKLGKPVVI